MADQSKPADATDAAQEPGQPEATPAPARERPKEIGDRKGPDPTRYGDWEINGRCVDF